MAMEKEARERLLTLIEKAHEEGGENIKRSRMNVFRAAAGEPLEPYLNEALLKLAREIASM